MKTIIIFILTVKSFNFVGTKLRGLTSLDIFVDTWIYGFLNYMQSNLSEQVLHWDLNFVECPTHEIHDTNLNDFNVIIVLQKNYYQCANIFRCNKSLFPFNSLIF